MQSAQYVLQEQALNLSYSEALEVARRLNVSTNSKRFKPAQGYTGWFAIDTSSRIWHDLNDIQLARIGLRREDLAARRPRSYEIPA